MDQLDREIAEAFADQPAASGPAQILVVGGPADIRSQLAKGLVDRHHRCTCVARLAEGQEAVGRERFDLVLIDPALADGDGLDLARWLRQFSPSTRTIVYCGGGSFQQAVEALRCGVIDFLESGATAEDVAARIDAALSTSRADTQREQRLAQLKVVCKKLVVARQEVSEHLDRLCKDLVAAYEDVSEQMSEVAMAAEFRTLLKQELDVEELLRTSLEYMLTRTGPTNAAVFLPDAGGVFELGAYVNYDCPRETITVLLSHLCRAVCPQMVDEGEIVAFSDADEFAQWVGADAGFLAGCQVLAFACLHNGKCMGVMVLFRNRKEPFPETLPATLDILRGIFAEQVAHVVKIHHRANPQWPKDADARDEYDASDYDDYGFGGLAA